MDFIKDRTWNGTENIILPLKNMARQNQSTVYSSKHCSTETIGYND